MSVGVITGLLGYGIGDHVAQTRSIQALEQELARAKHEQGRYAIRDRELRAQLEDTLAAHAALAREHELLQAHLAERVRRLEAACPDTSPSPNPALGPSH
jgi:hypothetical protein